VSSRGLRARLAILGVFAFALGCGVTARLVSLQLLDTDRYQRRVQSQRQQVRPLLARRGEIFDRHGRELALSVQAEAVGAHPARIEDKADAARRLARVLEMPEREIRARLASDAPFVYLRRQISPSRAARARELGMDGLVFEPSSRRVYPNRSLAAHALGFVGVDGQALGGIELGFNEAIVGSEGKAVDLADAQGVPFDHRIVVPAVPGNSLGLTIDLTVQHALEAELERAVHEAGGKAGSAAALDPETGEILAIASWPTFNPNAFSAADPEQRRDRVVVSAYEPGSTFKVITAAAALEQGTVRPEEIFDCSAGVYRFGRYAIRDHKRFDHLTFSEVIAHSSNVGAIRAGMRVPAGAFYDTIRRFGFGERTGLGLPGEQSGLLRPVERWSLLSQPALSIGQEVLVTPLQMLVAVAAVANDGVLMRPWIAREIRDPDGFLIRRFAPPEPIRVLSSRTARTLTSILEQVVSDGSGSAAAMHDYTAAGKTGTAQKSGGAGEGYEDGKYVASFVGFAPAHDPRVAAIFVVDEPRTPLFHGGDVAAPAFGRFASRILPLLGAVPEAGREGSPERLVVRRQDGTDPESRWRTLHRSSPAETAPVPAAARRGHAPARARRPLVAPSATPAAAPPPETDPASMPDLAGLTAREALARLTRRGVRARLEGSGRVVAQDPSPGARIADLQTKECRLWLQP
jgi:cell division protein FtsI/penicillin-binding protein 2